MPASKLLLFLLLIPVADTSNIRNELRKAALYNLENKPDSSYASANTALQLAISINDQKLQAAAEYQIGKSFMLQSDFTSSMQHILNAESLYRAVQDSLGIGQSNLQLGLIEYTQKNYYDALPYFNSSYNIGDKINNKNLASTSCYLIGRIYLETDQLQKAGLLLGLAMKVKKEMQNSQGYYECLSAMAELYYKRGEYQKSNDLFRECLAYFVQSGNPTGMAVCHYGLANAFLQTQNTDSALAHFKLSYDLSVENNYREGIIKSTISLAEFFRDNKQYDQAYDFLEQYHAIHDSVYNVDNTRKLAKLQYQLNLAQKQIEIDQLSRQNERDTNLKYLMAFIILLLAVFAITVFRFYRSEQKSKTNLKNAQKQLIRSEKLASLGELTAGVAHELKNPLNFIINFSESSNDLIYEIENSPGQIRNGTFRELKTNLEKIQLHGMRADSIISNMMMHARTATDKKCLINLQKLIQETIDLGYQAMRASKLSFFCKINTSLPKESIMVNVIPQEIGRIILNLLNNAFYATIQKKGTDHYEPEVNVHLFTSVRQAVITIEDNGIGISKELQSRIFEPFFTTKPPGEGTGLGLSMSYDMIQSNGGMITVESEEGRFTRFTISLPLAPLEATV